MKVTSEQLLKLAQLIWGSSLVRLGSFIAAAGVGALTGFIQYVVEALFLQATGVNLQLPENSEIIGWLLLALGVVVATLGSGQQLAINRPPVNPHDVQNFRDLHALIQPDLLFFRDHNFSFSFDRAKTARLDEFLYTWRGATRDFVDHEVQARLIALRERAAVLCEALVGHTYPVQTNMAWSTVNPGSDALDAEARAAKGAKLLNEAATAYVEAVDEFEAVAKIRIPTAQ